MRSMTGFGQAAAETPRYRIAISLRAVNHRYLDLVLRLREEQRASEPALRDLLSAELERGRVELGVEVRSLAAPGIHLEIDEPSVAELAAGFERLERDGLIDRGLSAGDLLRLPQLVRVVEEPTAWEEEDEALLVELAGTALAQLVAARETEGARLGALLAERLDGIEAAAAELAELAAGAPAETAAALGERLAALLGGSSAVDPQRLAQEVALLADRGDVSEELDRLGAHLAHFREVAAATGAVGRRLDFLTQEIFRELNTLGSKCRHAAMTRLVLDAKTLAEQLREQVQNVE